MNVISFVIRLQSNCIGKCNCNQISRHANPMANAIQILWMRLQQETQLSYPPRSPPVWFFKICTTFISNEIDMLNCVCAPRGPSQCSTVLSHSQYLIVVSDFFQPRLQVQLELQSYFEDAIPIRYADFNSIAFSEFDSNGQRNCCDCILRAQIQWP